ncbi:Uma2 family endonuclease [Geobacillus sp. TFV-3]|uniref:Uma2 family endonuclease n=1 Tax=Geobacillus sp. TFV-3 TaxID=1897059 RepID=UPI00135BCF39|nr:Uma2 family endonuclease [Geobacillus sp. TFV-3]KAF0996780.1 hypothetical protein BJQ97_03470 [Geobacillus sp. TFV-3]
MNFPEKQAISLNEFYGMRETTDRVLEYIDGVMLMPLSFDPAPTPIEAVARQTAPFFKKNPCEVFHAPFDAELKNERIEGEKIVVPDLTVICDRSGLMDTKFVGVPMLIIEILSPSNQAYDLVFKLNLYTQYGVHEYWDRKPYASCCAILLAQ